MYCYYTRRYKKKIEQRDNKAEYHQLEKSQSINDAHSDQEDMMEESKQSEQLTLPQMQSSVDWELDMKIVDSEDITMKNKQDIQSEHESVESEQKIESVQKHDIPKQIEPHYSATMIRRESETKSDSESVDNDDFMDMDEGIMAMTPSEGSETSKKLYRQITSLLIAYDHQKDLNEIDIEIPKMEFVEESESESEHDDALPATLKVHSDKMGEKETNKEEIEWNKEALQILEAHKKKQLNKEHEFDKEQVDKARKLVEQKKKKKKTRHKINKSVFQRKDLLKLSKAKLARKCSDCGVPATGTKHDMIKRILAKENSGK